MNMSPHEVTFREGHIRVDQHARVLFAGGHLAKLGGRAFDLLEALIERRDRVVPKQELMDVVWPGLIVEENNLQVHITTLRKLLGRDSITTVSGRGYRFTLVPDGDSGERARQAAPDSVVVPDTYRLPSASTLMIGREALTRSICAVLRRDEVRLVTLTGAGGSGKTRMALHVTGELAHDFTDGSYIVVLAPVRDPALVASAVATVMNIQEAGSRSTEDLLIDYLRDREALLTLDNFEHVLAATPLITRVLDTCARLKVLVTSRSVLKLSAEHDIVVPPLALPDPKATAARASESPAVRLFIERAEAVGQDIGASESNIAIAAQICRCLDGLPLAIELAAARLRMLSPQALLVRLDHRLQLLKSGPTNLPERQKTLRSAINWSYELLNGAEQALFRRLSVFVGGWSLEAAEVVGSNGNLAETVLDLLTALVDQSLVQRIEDVNGEPRFTMLETVREFAHEQLDASAELTDLRQRHADYYTQLAEALEPELTSARRKPALAQLQAEHNNLRAALPWLIKERVDAEAALRLVGALPWMWYFAGQFSEGGSWLREALELPGTEQHVAARARALSGAARLAFYAGDSDAGIHLGEQSVELWRNIGDRRGLAYALFHEAIPTLVRHGLDRSRILFEESLQCFRALDDTWGVALATTYLGVALTLKPDDENEAQSVLLQGRARFSALGDDWGVSTSSHYLGTIAMRRGDYEMARAVAEETVTIARDLDDSYRISRSLHQLAEIALAQNSPTEAIERAKASLALSREQGRIGDGAQQLCLLARLHLMQRLPDRAVRLFAAASLHDAKDRTMPPDDPALNQSALDSARQQLGERRSDAEWALGTTMSFDQAVSWALND